jgi:hypothetical protein
MFAAFRLTLVNKVDTRSLFAFQVFMQQVGVDMEHSTEELEDGWMVFDQTMPFLQRSVTRGRRWVCKDGDQLLLLISRLMDGVASYAIVFKCWIDLVTGDIIVEIFRLQNRPYEVFARSAWEMKWFVHELVKAGQVRGDTKIKFILFAHKEGYFWLDREMEDQLLTSVSGDNDLKGGSA